MLILTDYLAERQIKMVLNREVPLAYLALDLYVDRLTGGTSAHLLSVFTYTRGNRPKGVLVLDH